jgi:histidinol-phosphate aminotransferase
VLKSLVAPHIAALEPDAPGRPPTQLARDLGISQFVPLASNENPLGPSPRVREAMLSGIDQIHRYPDHTVHELRERLASRYSVLPEELALGHGSNSLIEVIAQTFATPEEHAVIGAPSFSCYRASLAAAHVPTTVVPLRDGLYWDLDAVRAAVRPETKLIFLDNPGNPVSLHIPGHALQSFVRELSPHVVLVIDEAYAEFADAPDFASALGMRELRERLIVLRTFSKAYALAGLRVGYAIANRTLIARMAAMRVPFTVSSLAQLAAVAALDDAEHLLRTVEHNARERRRVTQQLRRAGLFVADSQTNFLLVAFQRAAAPIHRALLERGLLTQLPGPMLLEHLRVSIGLEHENDLLVRRLFEVLELKEHG